MCSQSHTGVDALLNQALHDLINEAYDIAHDHNKNGHRTTYTHEEAIVYDPLVRALYQAKKIMEIES